MVEIYLPEGHDETVRSLVGGDEIWHETLSGEKMRIKVLLEAGQTVALLDKLEHRFGNVEGFRVVRPRTWWRRPGRGGPPESRSLSGWSCWAPWWA